MSISNNSTFLIIGNRLHDMGLTSVATAETSGRTVSAIGIELIPET